MRKLLKITSRVSSVTNSFVQAIIPHIEPSDEERAEALNVLGQAALEGMLECVYCGAPASDWDHFRPLVKNRRPTGYIHEVRNLVPSCGTCNQSKSGHDWHVWLVGNAKGSPKSRGVKDIPQRMERLSAFEAWGDVRPLDLEALAGRELWNAYWDHLKEIEQRMVAAQVEAERVQSAIRRSLEPKR
ncbi:HNH endonuclease [Archangium violaceum]|uniref:HNH endonuclease signature motif containing protein n=1 Tax=Archangium violaceum TaxID=83451 RepID=UPI002B2AE733|nr:HNH endonuclease [Archangium gephyra]